MVSKFDANGVVPAEPTALVLQRMAARLQSKFYPVLIAV